MAHIELTATRTYDASPEVLWAIVADLDAYAHHVRGLAVTQVIDGHALGATRRCETKGGDDWTEQVTEWDDGRRYAVDVDTSTYPTLLRSVFSAFRGVWIIAPDGEGARVTVTFRGTVRGGPLVAAVIQQMAKRNLSHLEETLASYAVTADGQA